MKSLKVMAAMVIAAATFSACGNSSAPRADLKSDVDSMSYAAGYLYSQNLRQMIQSGQVIDTAYMDDLVKGINDGIAIGDNKKKTAYIIGQQIGQQLSNQIYKGLNRQVFGDDSTHTLSMKNMLSAFITGIKGKPGLMEVNTANQIFQTKMESIRSKNLSKQYGANKIAGEKFLAANKKKEGVVTLPSGLQYKVIKEGNGAAPKDTSFVQIQYEGRTIDGKVFDSTAKNNGGKPMTMMARQFVPGMTEALTHMKAGSTYEIYIPQNLAYRDQSPTPAIKPFSTLIFKVTLVKIGR